MADAENKLQEDAVKYSVQTPNPTYSGLMMLGAVGMYAQTLPSIYSGYRQYALRQIAIHPQNSMWQGTVASLARDLAGAPWEIIGERRAQYFQEMLLDSEKGEGWESFVFKYVTNLYGGDDGAVVELVGRGDPESYLPRELITGINNLDPLRCHFTGNPQYPVFYQDAFTGDLHKIHWSRVVRSVDQPFTDPTLNGRGFCALSRAIAWVQQQIHQQTYIGESLNNEMPPGYLLVNGVLPQKWEDAKAMYLAALRQKGAAHYLPVVEYIHPPTGEKVTIEFVRIATIPEGWDMEKGYEVQAKGLSLATGVDINDIWPMSGGNFGVAGQAKVLDKKSKGKSIGFLISIVQRMMNRRILPCYLEYKSKYRDTEKSLEEAQTALAHTQVANGIAPYFPVQILQRYLVKVVPGLAEVALDAKGNLLTFDDLDEKDPAAVQDLQTVDDNPAEVDPADAQTVEDDAQPETKDYEDIRMDFTAAMYDTVTGMNDGSINSRRRAGVIIRGHINSYGRKAMIAGLARGGVEVDTLEGDDLTTFKGLVAENSLYVSGLTNRVMNAETPMSEAAVRAAVDAWANKTLQAFELAGLVSADGNALYEFVGDDGQESCDDCRRLKGKVFRLKDWIASRYAPGLLDTRLECGGYHCEHKLRRVSKGRSDRRSIIGLKALPDPNPQIITIGRDAYTVLRRTDGNKQLASGA